METDIVKINLGTARIKWNAMQWHKATLMAKISKIEKDTLSKIKQVPRKEPREYTEVEIELVYADATKATKEQLEARMDHYYLTMEYLDLLGNIVSTENLIGEYLKHVQVTQEEEEVFISDGKISAKIKEIHELKITDKKQLEIFNDLCAEFKENSSKFNRKERYEFYTSLENLYISNC